MLFTKIKYFNFRNIENGSLDTDSRNVILEGINGQGKTNVLESVYLLSYGSSFRTANAKEPITFGAEKLHLACTVTDDDGQVRTVDYINHNGKRRILLDSKDIRDRKELIYSAVNNGSLSMMGEFFYTKDNTLGFKLVSYEIY